jgi:ParB family chromosome partitioning protein
MPRDSIDSLAGSIAKDGVLQPIVVRPKDGGYEIIAGERRWRAARQAGLDKIPVIVRDVTDQQALELALVENIQREDLNPIDKAKAYGALMQEHGYTQERLAERLGQKRPTIANSLRLLELPEDIQEIVSRGTISPGHARALLSLESPARMMTLCRRIIADDLSVRATEFLASTEGGRARAKKARRQVSAQIRHLEDVLTEKLGTRVRIKQQKKGGQIQIHFVDNDDFDRLLALLCGVGGGG